MIVAVYIYAIVDRAITYSTLRWQYNHPDWGILTKSRRDHLRKSFEAGMVDRIRERLKEMKAERVAEAASSGRDLVIVKKAIVDEGYAKLYKELGLRITKGKAFNIDPSAYVEGQSEANKVAFNSGIGQNAAAAKIR